MQCPLMNFICASRVIRLALVVLSVIIIVACVVDFHLSELTAPRRHQPRPLRKLNRTDLDKYVILDVPEQCNSRRLGNHMFNIAAVLYVARLMGRRPAIPPAGDLHCLRGADLIFDLATLDRLPYEVACPCYEFSEEGAMNFDERVHELTQLASRRNVSLAGYYQSWRYVLPVDDEVRSAFVFHDHIKRWASTYVDDVRRLSNERRTVVGVHVRRGDMTHSDTYNPPGKQYYRRAMEYFVERFRRVQFIVCSDDIDWSRQNVVYDHHINNSRNGSTSDDRTPIAVSITFCRGRTAGHDLAVLSMCDNMIVSAGTFGWWSAWLANGTTVYPADWPREGLRNITNYDAVDYYPPHWISISY